MQKMAPSSRYTNNKGQEIVTTVMEIENSVASSTAYLQTTTDGSNSTRLEIPVNFDTKLTNIHLAYTGSNLFVIISCKDESLSKNMYIFPKADIHTLDRTAGFTNAEVYKLQDKIVTYGIKNKCARYENVTFLQHVGGESVVIASINTVVGREIFMIKDINEINNGAWFFRLKSAEDKNTVKYLEENSAKEISKVEKDPESNNLTITYSDNSTVLLSPQLKGGRRSRASTRRNKRKNRKSRKQKNRF